MQKPIGVKGATVWTPRFSDGENAPCLSLIAATGNPEVKVHVVIQKPDGERVEDKTLVSKLDYIYCADTGGPHPVNIICPSNDRYAFAALSCDREPSLAKLSEKQSAP